MTDRRRAKLILASLLLTFVVVRLAMWVWPDSDFDVAGYNVHHLFTGVLVLTASMLPLALGADAGRAAMLLVAGSGVGLSLVLDEWVYLIVTDGSNASYLLPVSLWGAVALHAAVTVAVIAGRWPRRGP